MSPVHYSYPYWFLTIVDISDDDASLEYENDDGINKFRQHVTVLTNKDVSLVPSFRGKLFVNLCYVAVKLS